MGKTHSFREEPPNGGLEARGGRVIDLSSRFPRFEPPKGILPRIPLPLPTRATIVYILIAGLVGTLGGLELGRFLERSRDAKPGMRLVQEVVDPTSLYVDWPEISGGVLRLVAPYEASGDALPPDRLSPVEARAGELWLYRTWAHEQKSDALLALATWHVRQTSSRPALLLAQNELELHRARFGPTVAVLNQLAVIEALEGELPSARRSLEHALAMAPAEPVLLFNMALIYRVMGPAQMSLERHYVDRYLQQEAMDSRWRQVMEVRLAELSEFRARLSPPLPSTVP